LGNEVLGVDAKAVLLDLDGTLLDTAPDLAAAINAMLAGQGLAPLLDAVVTSDQVGARAAGCRVLLVTYGYSEGRDVRELDQDGVVATLTEAADLLLR